MAGYKVQGKTKNGDVIDIPLAATYDANGNEINKTYAKKTNITIFFDEEGKPCWKYEDITKN